MVMVWMHGELEIALHVSVLAFSTAAHLYLRFPYLHIPSPGTCVFSRPVLSTSASPCRMAMSSDKACIFELVLTGCSSQFTVQMSLMLNKLSIIYCSEFMVLCGVSFIIAQMLSCCRVNPHSTQDFKHWVSKKMCQLWLVHRISNTEFQKNVPTLACYNFTKHQLILIIFGKQYVKILKGDMQRFFTKLMKK